MQREMAEKNAMKNLYAWGFDSYGGQQETWHIFDKIDRRKPKKIDPSAKHTKTFERNISKCLWWEEIF